jgi:DNA topoisomerase VI subunit A
MLTNPELLSCCVTVYKYGRIRPGVAAQYTVPSLRWLGVTRSMLAGASEKDFQPLTRRDISLVQSLKAFFALHPHPDVLAELDEMERCGQKAEIEAIYSQHGAVNGLAELLASCLIQED